MTAIANSTIMHMNDKGDIALTAKGVVLLVLLMALVVLSILSDLR